MGNEYAASDIRTHSGIHYKVEFVHSRTTSFSDNNSARLDLVNAKSYGDSGLSMVLLIAEFLTL